jgi:formylglycine-generating enzyme required for sulfatase activity
MIIGCFVIPLIIATLILSAFFFVRSNASSQLTVPQNDVLLVRSAPDPLAPLLARYGEGRTLEIVGRSEDWRWLEVELWADQRGWALRPLDILPWQLDAPPTTPVPEGASPIPVAPVAETMIPIPATIDRTEVTVGQYWQCVEAGACSAAPSDASQTEPHYLNDPVFDNHPVINVPWAEANRYCSWRGKRLPTEAEWEMAAGWDAERGAKLQWPWGNDPAQGQANLAESSAAGDAAIVGTFPEDESPAAVLDMGGNVSEWVFDWYKVDYYGSADDTDPVGPTHRRGEGSGRVVRGGAFSDTLEQARTTRRGHQEPVYGYLTVGFRCARDLD